MAETRILRLIGYWDGPAEPDGWPDVCRFVAAVDPTVQRTVADYLRSGTVLAVAAGFSACRLCGAANGSAELTDGVHFIWPEGLAHYVEDHGVRLPDEIADVAALGVAATVDPEPDVTVDEQWWRRQTGESTTHRPGCRHSPAVASWDLPVQAEIYVDRVPPDAVAVLARIRRLLGIGWPFTELRRLLGAQPVHAVAGNPAALHHSLIAAPELRPYLFYEAGGALLPIWPA